MRVPDRSYLTLTRRRGARLRGEWRLVPRKLGLSEAVVLSTEVEAIEGSGLGCFFEGLCPMLCRSCVMSVLVMDPGFAHAKHAFLPRALSQPLGLHISQFPHPWPLGDRFFPLRNLASRVIHCFLWGEACHTLYPNQNCVLTFAVLLRSVHTGGTLAGGRMAEEGPRAGAGRAPRV